MECHVGPGLDVVAQLSFFFEASEWHRKMERMASAATAVRDALGGIFFGKQL